MKRKRALSTPAMLLAVSLVILLALSIAGVTGHRTAQDTVCYTDDYPTLYKEQLQIIFGEDYQISEKETVVVEGEDCGCGYHSDSYVYDRWTISYQDQNGQAFSQTMDNTASLEAQQLTWLKEQLRQYYQQRYLIWFFDEGTFEGLSTADAHERTYCSITIGSPVYSYTSDQEEEFERISKAGEVYLEQLQESLKNKETMLRLSDIQYKDIFTHLPVVVRFHLSINDAALSGAEKEAFEKAVRERVMEMIQAVGQETGGTCSLRIQINSANGHCDLYDGARDWRYFILQGEPVWPEDTFDGFEWQYFYAFEGIYW